MPDDLYDVVIIRKQMGGEIRRPFAGPYDLIDARFYAKRYQADSLESDFIVVPHHVCQMCLLLGDHSVEDNYDKRVAMEAEMQTIAHTCTHYYNTAEPV
jgi:hypothetical protein